MMRPCEVCAALGVILDDASLEVAAWCARHDQRGASQTIVNEVVGRAVLSRDRMTALCLAIQWWGRGDLVHAAETLDGWENLP